MLRVNGRVNKISVCVVLFLLISFIVRAFGAINTGYATMYGDEVLHWGISKSIFENGETFIRNFPVNRFTCLYSIVISWVHLFEDYEFRYVVVRIFNSGLMVSAMIPFYLLAKAMFSDEKKALGIMVIASLIPEFAYSARVLQENLFFPMVMWTVYYIYYCLKDEEIGLKQLTILAILSFLCYWTRQAGVCLILGIISYFGWNVLFGSSRISYLKKLLYYILVFGGVYFIVSVMYKMANSSLPESADFTGIFSNIGIEYIIYWIRGGLHYLLIVLICTGFFTLVLPLLSFKFLKKRDQHFFGIILLITAYAIIESVGMFYVLEGMNRIHLRYIFFMIPLIMLCFFKAFNTISKEQVIYSKKDKVIIYGSVIVGIILLWTIGCFSVMGSNVDGNSSRFIISNVSMISQWFNDVEKYKKIVSIILTIFVIVGTMLILEKKYIEVMTIVVSFFVVVQVTNNYLCYAEDYNLKVSLSQKYDNDFVRINEYIEDNIENEETIALLSTNYMGEILELHVARNIYCIPWNDCLDGLQTDGTLINNKIKYIGWGQKSEEGEIPDYIIMNKVLNQEVKPSNYEVVCNTTNYLILKKSSDVFRLNYGLFGMTTDGWIMDGEVRLTVYKQEGVNNICIKTSHMPGAVLGIRDTEGKEKTYNLDEVEGYIIYSLENDLDNVINLTLYGAKTIKPKETNPNSLDDRNLCAQIVEMHFE